MSKIIRKSHGSGHPTLLLVQLPIGGKGGNSLIKSISLGCKKSSVVQSLGGSFGGPGFNTQTVTTIQTPFPRNPLSSFDLCLCQAHRYFTDIHKEKHPHT